jgi:hypothetical protein
LSELQQLLRAAGALGTGATEERVGRRDARLLRSGAAEEDADRRASEGLALTELLGEALHLQITRRHRRVAGDTEHPLRLVVVRR